MDKVEFIRSLKESLTESQRKKLLELICEISEKSYRRAVQQTLTLDTDISDWIKKDKGYTFRFKRNIKKSIGLDGFVTTSIFRVLCEELDLKILEPDKKL